MPAAVPTVETPTTDPSSPFAGAFPVIHPGSPGFGALTVASGKGSF
jgi:hypothetical protein